ncbi:MAG: hypothetical protein A2Z59_07770 [Nitrospinae bacterium RIFCSPLOWO2_02_39_17]|nr:MAG: hypothetical protein A2Z59_07770 [Nitrospinae bacterium RIFCSPLOWO2_02_39_17]OGW07826.1 MAG: hypothetical protein A2W75_02120 [Nitrospinae bacterium RIFCSPLOWO2_12_39_15]
MENLDKFVCNSIEKWEKIKNDFSHNKEMSAFLKKSYLVVVFDHYQFEINFVKNLYKPLSKKGRECTPEEIKAEELRKQMVSYYENNLKEMTLEIRFPTVVIELIQELKMHLSIKDLNSHRRASIRVAISRWNLVKGGETIWKTR